MFTHTYDTVIAPVRREVKDTHVSPQKAHNSDGTVDAMDDYYYYVPNDLYLSPAAWRDNESVQTTATL